MLGWLSGFFGIVNGSDTASALAKDISSGVDMMVYTDEEKAIASTKATDAWLRMVEAMKGAEAYRSITRRILAVGVIFNLLCVIWICLWMEMLQAFSVINLPMSTVNDYTFTSVTWSVLRISSIFHLGWVFCTIIVFYFGPHLIQHLKKPRGSV